jgi:Rrf2 family transcriptional regulator, nitric oxide-sensitive transcriptional repressor
MSSPLNIPESVSLALHALAKLASATPDTVKLGDLLIKPGSSDHLSKVMQRLTKSGMVSSRKGRGGGFTLAVDPGDIRLMDVWIALEGTFQSGSCPYMDRGCPLPRCIFGTVFDEASATFRDYFTRTTIADLGSLLGEGS